MVIPDQKKKKKGRIQITEEMKDTPLLLLLSKMKRGNVA